MPAAARILALLLPAASTAPDPCVTLICRVGAASLMALREWVTAIPTQGNLKIAKALDLTVPPSLLARADEVIE